MFALANDEAVIHHCHRLQCGERDVAGGGELGAVRAIKTVHKRIGQGAKQIAIDAAAIAFGTVHVKLGIIHFGRHAGIGVVKLELHYRGTAHFQVQFACNLEDGIADFLGIEAGAIHAPEIEVAGITFIGLGIIL